jgi:hypothetical protein
MTLEEKLKAIKVGDIVKLRCDGECIIDSLSEIYIHCGPVAWTIRRNGKYGIERDCPFDIIDVIPAPFDWDTVKQGMGFKCKTHGYYHRFVAFSEEGVCGEKRYAIMYSLVHDELFRYSSYKDVFTRAPEYDL